MFIRTKTNYFPAFENDLTDYSKTEFAESFGYERADTEINTNDSSYVPEENYSYGWIKPSVMTPICLVFMTACGAKKWAQIRTNGLSRHSMAIK